MQNLLNKFKYFILGGVVVLAGSVYAVQISVPSSNGPGFLLQSLSNGTYFPVSLTAGTNVTISSSTSNITISATGGGGAFPFTVNSWGNSTTSTLGFLNGFLSTASSTISSAFRLPSLSQGLLYVGSTGLVNTIASSSLNVGTATALAANGSNCSSGSAPLGVDASGASENCFDVWTEAENTSASYLSTVDISANTNLTAGDALTLTGDDIDFDGGTSPGGSLGGTWASPTIDDLFILNTGDVGTGSYTFPYASSTGFSSSYASSTDLRAGFLRISGLSDGCLSIASGLVTSAGIACGSGSGGSNPFTNGTIGSIQTSATTSLMLLNGNASTTGLSANYAFIGQTATTTITPAGYVGIGTSTPFGNLSINAPAQTNPYFVIGSSTSEVFKVSPSTTGSATLTISTSTAGCLNITGTGLVYSATCAGGGSVTSVVAGVGFLNRGLNITGSGTLNVGIATSTTPSLSGLPYWTGIGDATNPATLGTVATSSLAVGASISSSGTLGSQVGGTASTLSLNMANANTWTALQTFANSTTSLASFSYASTTQLRVGSGQGYGFIGSNGLFGVISSSTLAINMQLNCATITGSADLCDGNDATGGSGAVSTSTVDWIIYKKGTNTVVYDTITNTDVLTTTTFGAACNYIVNQATSTFPARVDVAVRTGYYNAGADCIIDGNSNQYGPTFNFNFVASSTEVFVASGLNAFRFQNQASANITNLTCGVVGTATCLFATTTSGTQSSLRESYFKGINVHATTTHTGWAIDLINPFRNHFESVDLKFVANGVREQCNTSGFNCGDTTYERGFTEILNSSIGYMVKMEGNAGTHNQNTFIDWNGISNDTNDVMWYFKKSNWNRVMNSNAEEFATTTEYYNSNANTFISNKYMNLGNSGGVVVYNDANSYNNSFSCKYVEITSTVVLMRDLNTVATTRPNSFGNFEGGVCTIGDDGGTVSFATTSTSVVANIHDNLTGALSYLNSTKLTGNKLFFNWQSGVTNFMEYVGSALRTFVNGTERQTITSTGLTGISSSTPNHTLSVGSSNTGTFGISTTTNGCVQATNGLFWITGTACGSGSGTSAFEIATSSSLALSQVAYISQVSGRTTLSSVATSSLVNGTGITITNGSSAFVLGAQPTFNCNTASASVFGCLAASDFSKFNSATTTFGSGYATTTLGTLTFSTTTLTRNGQTFGMTIVPSAGALTFTPTLSGTLDNAGLTNSTISGVALGSNLNALTNDATLNGSSYNGSGAISDWGLNLANANTWTVNQTFNYSSSTIYSSFVTSSTTNARIGLLTLSTTTAGTLKTDTNGVVWADTAGGSGGYATIQDEGSGLTVRTILNFSGSGVACADDTTRTTCTINAGAATAGGSDTQVQFNDGTSLGGAVAWIWNKTREIMGIGTTTPFSNHKVSIATSTGQNLVLLTGGNDAGVSFRNIAGSLYLSTTSPTTGATSTSPSALVVDYSSGMGKVGIGSTTPWAALGIQPSSYDYSFPLFQVATSTSSNGWGTAFHVTATSSTFGANGSNGKATSDSGVRVGVGLYDYEGYGGLLDQFTVNGRINTQGWLETKCDTQQFTSLSADGQTSCHGLYFAEDGTGTATGSSGSGYGYTRIAAAVNNDGAGVFLSTSHVVLSTSTPVMEVNYRIRNSTATTSQFFIGFHNRDFTSTAFETEPTIGCYFTASSTTANWRAICRTASGGANMTMVDTGIASTSSNAVNGTGYQFRKFRIQADSTKAEFFIKASETEPLKKVAQISTTYPANTSLNAGIHYGIVSINTSSGFDYFRLRYWRRDVLPSL